MTVQIWLRVFHVRPLHYTSLVKYIIRGEWSVNGVTWLHFHVTRNIIRRYKEPVMTRARVWNRLVCQCGNDDNNEILRFDEKFYTPLRFIPERFHSGILNYSVTFNFEFACIAVINSAALRYLIHMYIIRTCANFVSYNWFIMWKLLEEDPNCPNASH